MKLIELAGTLTADLESIQLLHFLLTSHNFLLKKSLCLYELTVGDVPALDARWGFRNAHKKSPEGSELLKWVKFLRM